MSTPDGPPSSPVPPPAPAPPPVPSHWVAPSGPAPTGAPTTPPQGGFPSAPPEGLSSAPRRKRLHPGVIAAIAGGGLFLAAGIAGIVVVANSVAQGIASQGFPFTDDDVPYEEPEGDHTPLVDGEPGSPLAVTPTRCDAACFDTTVIRDIIPDDSLFDHLALDQHIPWYPNDTTTAADEFDINVGSWKSSELGPDECFITWPYSPIIDPIGSVGVADDPIDFIGSHSDLDYYNEIDLASRLFADDEAASAYMVALDAALGECPRYIDSIGSATDFVTRSAAIDVPDSVAAVGWIQKTQYDERYYVIDVQRGNLVVRTTGYSTGGYSELEFRDLVEQEAALLAELEVVG
ncbi:MAG: hypothetical protein ABIQ01_06095 [Pseudolysinimonas sp.]